MQMESLLRNKGPLRKANCLSVYLFICSAMGGKTARPNGLKFGG